MKNGFTYVAAIALLTAGTAFAQAQSSSGAAGVNGSTINNSTPTPAAKGAAEGAPRTSTGTSSGTMMNQSGSIDKSGSSMDQSSDMDRSSKPMKNSSMNSKAKAHHVARARGNASDAKENQETMQLNRQQIAGGSSSMNNMGPGSMGSRGMSSSNPANPFDNGSPQQAQAGGPNCSPDNPSCGTARQNPAIQSSPQHRTYGDQEQ
ncbi:MAG TPA: hypothetical protein VG328_14855 [Stellaceae bacterium]|jgi:hypothetical protein|nr:hypothetical protein [Stellaceae bacterium]